MKFIACNFLQGNGPYQRTTDVALAVCAQLQSSGQSNLGILVPWVYGEKQKQIMKESLSAHPEVLSSVFLDSTLGTLISMLFYRAQKFNEMLETVVAQHGSIQSDIRRHLEEEDFEVESLAGKKMRVKAPDILMEINRSSTLSFGNFPRYNVTYGYLSQIVKRAMETPAFEGKFPVTLAERFIRIAQSSESKHVNHFISRPGSFNLNQDYVPTYKNETLIPPLTQSFPDPAVVSEDGIYVTISGISGLQSIYADAQKLGVKIYTNNAQKLGFGEQSGPAALQSSNILAHFARSGWGSVWLSLLHEKPLILTPYIDGDDPEIYFNNASLLSTGLALEYRGESFADLRTQLDGVMKNQRSMKAELMKTFGTLDGAKVASNLIVQHYLRQSPS